jgi:hypothetical protein
MPDDPLLLISAALAAILTTVVAALATRVRLLPDVIDLSFIPTGSGVMSLVFVAYGALRRFHPDRIARLALLGAARRRRDRRLRAARRAGRCSLVRPCDARSPPI